MASGLGAPKDTDYVFQDRKAGPVNPGALSRQLDAAVAASGLPRIRLHDTRHSHVAVLLAVKVPVEVVSKRGSVTRTPRSR